MTSVEILTVAREICRTRLTAVCAQPVQMSLIEEICELNEACQALERLIRNSSREELEKTYAGERLDGLLIPRSMKNEGHVGKD